MAIPSAVLYELEVGIAKSTQPKKRRQGLEALPRLATILPFDEAAARAAASVRVGLGRSATLVTHNTREFSRVRGLRVVDWY